MKLPRINWSKVTSTIASVGAIAGTVANAASTGQLHVPPSLLTALIAVAWLGQSPLIHATQSTASQDSGSADDPKPPRF
ncbi:MAG TPA: hypothetical protein VGK19_21270 [Capsulimonadaceae bacterium]|jgi:hypothetical protein